MEAHHNEVEPQTIEAVIVQSADALSGARPGARGESLEQYVKRLRDLEQIATRHDGVDKVYAMQAGREIRVMVQPGSARRRRRGPALARDRPRDRAGARVPGPDQGHRDPGVARDGLRALSTRAATVAGSPRTCRVVKRMTRHPAAVSRASRARSRSNAARVRCRRPSVSTISRSSGQQKSTSNPSTIAFTSGRGMP